MRAHKKKTAWSKRMELSFEQRLAAVVKSLPILYDKSLPDFKDKVKRQNAWTEVALQLGLPSGK